MRTKFWIILIPMLILAAGVLAAPTESTVYTFCSAPNCTDGEVPQAGLIADSAGNLYGTTEAGGANNQGTVFELSHTENG